MTESLTEAVCHAVAMAGDLPTLIGDWPLPCPQSVIDLLRGSLEALDRELKASNSLVERAAEFRGLYVTPPEPIAGHSAASYHELGRSLALQMLHGVMAAANPSPGFIFSPDPFTESDFNRVCDNIPAARKYLREEAPRFDWQSLVARIEDEEAKAKQRVASAARPSQNIQINCANSSLGDVNIATSGKGSVVQTTGIGNTVQVEHPEKNFWGTLWRIVKACWKWLRG